MAIKYDKKRFDPAAPIIKTKICHPSNRKNKIKIDMQIDSGADMTCLPKFAIKELANLRSGSVKAMDYDGLISVKITKYILLIVEKQDVLLEVIPVDSPIDSPIGLLGRDFLNSYRTVLDGPNLEFDIEGVY